MTPKAMKRQLVAITNRYEPVTAYLCRSDFVRMSTDYVLLYLALLGGKSVKELALQMEIAPGEEEAVDLAKRLKTPEDFIEEAEEAMCLLVQCGVAEKKTCGRRSHLCLIRPTKAIAA